MKLKRMLALVLCFVMVLSTMSFNVFAEESVTETTDTVVAEVGDAEFTDIQEAIKEAAPNGTVDIVDDIVVDEWVMIAESLTISGDTLITLEIDGLTINGNGKTLTINSIESAGNGGYLFYDASNLTIENLTIKYADGLVGGIGLKAGTISGVTFDGGVYGVMPQTGDVTITGCTFKTNGTAIYFEEDRDGLVVDNNTFDVADGEYSIILRGDADFTNNTVLSGKVNLANSASGAISGNDFGDNRFKVYNAATANIENNEINVLVFNDDSEIKSTFGENTYSEDAEDVLKDAGVLPDDNTSEGGSGTEEDPILINTAEDLIALRDAVNSGDNYAGKYVMLNDDIDLSSVSNWTPIGDVLYNSNYAPADTTKVFSGTFDGNDKVISNLKIEKFLNDAEEGPDADANLGLFGIIGEGAVIKDLTITNVDITTDGRNVGALAGVAYKATLDNITVNGDIQITGGNNVCGVCAMTRYYDVSATNITVSGEEGSYINGNNIVAGMFAEIAPNGSNQTFENLSVENVAINGVGGVGGIVGLLTNGSVSNVSVKNVELVGNTAWPAGGEDRIRIGSIAGLLGSNNATISGVTVENVTAKNLDDEDVVLPVVGANYGASSNATEAKIGDTYYATLAKAFAAAVEGDTVTLLCDIENVIEIPDGVTLETNGYRFGDNLTGIGTKEDPYLINNIDDLVWFRNDVNAGNTYEGKYVKLTADIDLEGYQEANISGNFESTFRPIGDSGCSASFNGTFDGGDHTISNLSQSGWDLGYEWGSYGSLGLFGIIDGATVENLTVKDFELVVEGGDVAAISGSAKGTCVFRNINVEGCICATYNNGCGSIVAWSGAGNYTFENIKIDDEVVLAGLWGSFDSSIGGVVGQAEPGATYTLKNVDIACRLDVYNDSTASYDYYNYRMCGMIIGRLQKTISVDGRNYPDMSAYNITCEDVNVTIGEWANYHYCEPTPGYNNGRGMRVEPGYAYDGLPADYDHSQCTTNHMALMQFEQLFGGDQLGVDGADKTILEKQGFDTSTLTVVDLAKTADCVAKIGDDGFETLSAAITAAQPDDTIILLADVNEDVTIDKNISLDGNGETYTGTMILNSAITATIENVNFVNGWITKDTKSTKGNYTIKNCTFDGEGARDYSLRFKGAASITVENCDVKDYKYSFLYVTSGTNTVSVKNVTVEDCPNYAVYFASGVNSATIETLTVKNSNNGFIINNTANRALTIKDCKMENVGTAINYSKGTNTITCTVLGANDFGTSASSEYAKYVLGENATLKAPEGYTVTASNDAYFVKYVDGTYKSVKAIAQIGDVKYDTLAEAFKAATDGCTIMLLDDITVSELWDCRYNGAKFTVPVTIDGNEKTLKLTGKIEDSNWNTVFRFEADATVKNLTIDASEATSIQRGISSKYSITVDNCTLIGNGTTAKRGVIFGEGAGADINNVTATIKDSTFKGWSYGVSDNQNAKDAKAVSITGSDFENASVLVSASETIVFNGNDMDNGYVNISSYSVPNVLSVTAKDNTLDTETYAEYNTITAQTIDAQDGFIVPVAEANGKYYISLADAVSKANAGDTIKLLDEIVLTESIYVNEGKAITVDLNGKKLTGPDDGNANWYAFIVNGGDLTLKDSIGTGELWAACYGVETKSGSFTMESGKITATNNQSLGSAVVNYGGNVTVKGGTLSGAFAAVHTAGYFANASTELEGATINGIVSIENYDSNNYTQTVIAVTDDADDLPAVTAGYEWKTVGKVSKLFKSATSATVKALADAPTVKAGDTVEVRVIAEGFAFTNGDWELRYDPTMFELDSMEYYEDSVKGVKAQSVNSADANTLAGEIIAVGGTLQQGNEIPSGTTLATYTFTVLPQSKDTVSGKFDIVTAHINTYDYAISQTNVPAVAEDFNITITREGREITGSLEVANLTYNGDIQKGKAFVVSDSVVGKENAVITYSKTENGIYTTELPTFKEAGSYSIWVKVNVDGYAEYKYEHAYMVIGAKDITLSLEVAAGAAYNKVNVKPVITGVYDAEFEGILTISGVDYTYKKDDFIYMGNNMAIAKEAKPMSVVAGSNEVTITYTQAATDNYADASATKTVEADKAFATQTIVDDLNAAADAAVTDIYYNGTEHTVMDEIVVPDDWNVTVTRISDGTVNPGVTNVAEKEFVEIRFTHDNYNDVVVSRVLKVEPLDLTITVPDFKKGAGEPDNFTTKSVTYTSDNFLPSAEYATLDALVATGNLNVSIVRKTFGEEDGKYDLTATYTPNDNYDIVVEDGAKLTIGMPSDTKVEVVNNNVNGNGNYSADYVAGYRLVLVYTNTATARYTYDDKQMFNLSNAGYEYFDNTKSIAEQIEDNYKYVYGIIVKAETGADDAYYADKVDFIGTNKYTPEKIVYDADINYDNKFSNNDTSAVNSVLNVEEGLDAFTMYYFLKADYDRTADGEYKSDKMVKIFDVQEVQKFIKTKITIQNQ